MSSLPSARLSPEGSRLLSYDIYVSALPVAVPACITVMSVMHTSHRAQALACLSIWLAAPRGAANIYVPLSFGLFPYFPSSLPSSLIYIYIYICMCMCVCVCMYMYRYIHMCIIYTHACRMSTHALPSIPPSSSQPGIFHSQTPKVRTILYFMYVSF
jgi:hypothetical protein